MAASFYATQLCIQLTLKSDSDAIKSSNSFVAVDALCKAGDVWLNELCDRAV